MSTEREHENSSEWLAGVLLSIFNQWGWVEEAHLWDSHTPPMIYVRMKDGATYYVETVLDTLDVAAGGT